MDKPNVTYFLILLFSCCALSLNHSLCLISLDTFGFTVPSGDIIIEYGQPLNITCNIFEDIAEDYGKDASSHLFFYRNDQLIPREMVEVVNSTSIRLYIEKPQKIAHENFFCYFNIESKVMPHTNTSLGKLVCMNVVMVAVAPQNVTDFSCIGRNYENLTCSWTAPENYIETNYSLSYTFIGRAAKTYHKVRDPKSRERKPKILKKGQVKTQYPCPVMTTEDKKKSCFWNISTSPPYRLVQPTFIFTLNMNNEFGTNSLEYVFNHFENVLPNPPENLTAVATSPHSINLTWSIPSAMRGFPSGLHHRILYQCVYEKKWQLGALITNATKNEILHFELTNLKYAHNLCDIRVSMRSAAAVNNDMMWSETASKILPTKSKIPDSPPATTLGSFEIVTEYNSILDAYVYWQTVEPWQENGENFTYEVYMDSHPEVRYTELTKVYARFNKLPLSDYVLSIWSKNAEGFSTKKSTVVIPAARPALPRNFIKLEHQGLVELNWDAPLQSEMEITNYTIFWCNNDRERPHQCKGRLNWITVPKNVFKYNVSLSTNIIYQFAISSNSYNSSSGMLWAECTFIPDNAVGQMRNIWVSRVDSTFIELGWKLDCSDRIQTVAGYVIYYCPMISTEKKECNGSEEVLKINDNSVYSGKVDNLKPYTMYRLRVGVIMGPGSYSRLSDVLINSTNEDAPSTPTHVHISDVTNSSMSLNWQPPAERNGKLREYIIHYGTDTEKWSKKIGNDVNSFILSGLESYKKYWITIQACTIKCSVHSEIKTEKTRMWIPGEVDQPRVIFQNDSVTTIDWKSPNTPRGRIDYYQLKFTHDESQNDSTEAMVNVTNTQKYNIEECGQSGRYNKVLVSVRAVNIIDGVHEHGPWSKQLEAYCIYSSGLYIILCIMVVFIFVCAAVIFGFRKMYACCKSMQDVEVKLPPGLAPVIEQRGDLVPWSSEKSPNDIERSSRADEELLLEKISDSSGCSSGHESVASASSLKSTAHLSVDSGTDADENRRNSLRQRNVPCKGYVLPEAVQTNLAWGQKAPVLAPAGNYCVLGVDPDSKGDEGGSPGSMPYLACDVGTGAPNFAGDLAKAASPGYIAHEPAGKDAGYVVAGLPKELIAPPDRRPAETSPMTTHLDDAPYLKMDAGALPKTAQLAWHQPPLEPTRAGYVTVGDAPLPAKAPKEAPKGYVPHRQFEAKALKED